MKRFILPTVLPTVLTTTVLAGCFDGSAVEVEFRSPEPAIAMQYAPGCTAAVEIYLLGGNYATDDGDWIRHCIDIDVGNGSWDDVHAAIRDKFEASFPESGLAGIEIYGYAGACNAPNFYDHDMIFFSSAGYSGQDKLVLEAMPNLSCPMQQVKVRPIDLLKLIETNQCSEAGWTRPGKIALTTLNRYWFDETTEWRGGEAAANVGADGLATFMARTKTGPETCLAIGHYTNDWESVSCVDPAQDRVCATGSEIEAPMIPLDVAIASRDSAKATPWGSLVIGAVWSGTGPAANATVQLDDASKKLGEVVYFDMPAGVENGVGSLTARSGATSTGPSGLFGVYTQSLVTVKVTVNGKTVTRELGGYVGDTPDSHVALIKM